MPLAVVLAALVLAAAVAGPLGAQVTDAAGLLARARVARLTQDSALRAYDAISRERVTATLGVLGDLGPERTVFRQESAARVRWTRESGAEVELLGRRRFVGVPGMRTNDAAALDAPIPWYPGREALWIGGGRFVRTETREDALVHPFADGAEAYYAYAIGDSVAIRLPDGGAVRLRELRVTPRRAGWRLSVGSFWLDERTAQLVRAAYRTTAPMNLWDQARTNEDPTTRPPRWLPWLVGPAQGELRAVTVEHALHEGRIWLPRAQYAEGVLDAGASRIGVRIEQRFEYTHVNAGVALPPPLPPRAAALAAWRDSLVALDSTRTAALRRALADVRASRDSLRLWRAHRAWRDSSVRTLARARRADVGAQCAAGAQSTRTRTRYGRRLPARVVVPCDEAALATASIFTTPILAEDEAAWRIPAREELAQLLAIDRQPAWAPQPITLHGPFGYTRYNRVEGLSVGGAVRQTLGLGYRWEANARYAIADQQLGAEAWLERGDAPRRWRAGAYRRLEQADDYGAALRFGASVQNLVSGLDEQFYYRAAGAELTGTRTASVAGGPTLAWRAFAERQSDAPARARFTVQRAFGNDRASFDSNVVDTIPARAASLAGGAIRWRGLRGDDASPWRLASDARAEAAAGTVSYLRAALDLGVDRMLPGRLRVATLAAAGASAGTLPPQRWWNLGGWQTVRGYTAGTQRGDAFWLARAELRWERPPYVQPAVFADAGWAGDRDALHASFRRASMLQSAGAGVAFYNGLFRFDAARALTPGARWRWDSYAVARF
ncbi:MAG: ShlB/FhaC/HecB family hemolysin secretion/activation protein [Gemmatirosa sp.]